MEEYTGKLMDKFCPKCNHNLYNEPSRNCYWCDFCGFLVVKSDAITRPLIKDFLNSELLNEIKRRGES